MTKKILLRKFFPARFPHCFLHQQIRLFDFLGKLFGGQDINFEADPEFSKTYVLQGRNEEATARLFSPEVRRHF